MIPKDLITQIYKGYKIFYDKYTNKYVTEKENCKYVTRMNHSTYEKARAYVESEVAK